MGTDLMYYAVAADGLDGGAQITASHNPASTTAARWCGSEAFPLSGEAGIKEMKEMISRGRAFRRRPRRPAPSSSGT